MRFQVIQADLGRQTGFAFQMCNAQELQEIEITLFVLGINRHPGWPRRAAVMGALMVIGDRQEAADDRLDTGLGCRLAVGKSVEEIGLVDHGNRRHPVRSATVEQVWNADRALQQGEARPDAQMDKGRISQSALLTLEQGVKLAARP